MLLLLEMLREYREFVGLLLRAAARQDYWLERLSQGAQKTPVQALLKHTQMLVYPFI